jgi:hypothetical protein
MEPLVNWTFTTISVVGTILLMKHLGYAVDSINVFIVSMLLIILLHVFRILEEVKET